MGVVTQTARLDGLNVIAWCLEESYQHIQDSQPLRALQGLNLNNIERILKASSTATDLVV